MKPTRHHAISALLVGAAAVAAPAAATAAALERAVPAFVRIFYEDGTYGEIGLTFTDPDLDGEDAVVPASLAGTPTDLPVSGNTGNLLRSDWKLNGAIKGDFSEALSWILVFDQPYVANTSYGQGTFSSVFNYGGTEADLDTYQLSGGLAYDVGPNVKLFGGVRAQRLDASASLTPLYEYAIDAEDEWGWGGFVGAAYARPEIGLRVALTYQTKISYSLDTTETATLPETPLSPGGPVRVEDTTDVDTPQSAQLEAQIGVNEKTLLFGSARWVDWSEFAIAPDLYGDITEAGLLERRALVDYPSDWWTFNAGVARSFTDTLAGSLSVTYEPKVDEVLTTLGPVDGRTTINAGLSYDIGKVNVSGGLSYGWLGDTTNLLETRYRDGTIFAAALRLGYAF